MAFDETKHDDRLFSLSKDTILIVASCILSCCLPIGWSGFAPSRTFIYDRIWTCSKMTMQDLSPQS